MPRALVFLVALLHGLTAATAAQTTAPSDIYRWLAPDAAAQAAAATTPIPPGAGAILVPSMSGPDTEPQALVFRGDEQVASGPNGARIVVEPGAYLVRVGSGPMSQMVSVPVDVQGGTTTVVPVRWGALRIEVVDERNLPHRGTYELIRVADRQPYTVGFGADTLQGERLLTLLMAPGLYRIVQSGSTYRARTDFATVLVPEGGLVHYRLVINPTSGQFRGAGVVTPDELGAVPDVSTWEAPEVSPWNRRYAIGLSAPFASTRNVIGASNETTFGTDLFFDNYITYQRDRDLFSSVLELESGFVKVKPEASAARPWQRGLYPNMPATLNTSNVCSSLGAAGRVKINCRTIVLLLGEPTGDQETKMHNRTDRMFAQAEALECAAARVECAADRIERAAARAEHAAARLERAQERTARALPLPPARKPLPKIRPLGTLGLDFLGLPLGSALAPLPDPEPKLSPEMQSLVKMLSAKPLLEPYDPFTPPTVPEFLMPDPVRHPLVRALAAAHRRSSGR